MWLDIAIAVGLIVWAVGGLIALNPLPKESTEYMGNLMGKIKQWSIDLWEIAFYAVVAIAVATISILGATEQVEYLAIIGGSAAFVAGLVGRKAPKGTVVREIAPELLGIAIGVIAIDQLYQMRFRQQEKMAIISQLSSFSNDFAIDAVRLSRDQGLLIDGSLKGIDLTSAKLAGAPLYNANLEGVTLRYAKLEGANLFEVNLNGADLWRSTLTGAYFSSASLERADLQKAEIGGADFVKATLIRANLQDANLEQVNLMEAFLVDANLTKANLWNADLTGAHLYGANLAGGYLVDANLKRADLGRVNFEGADLRLANLEGADLWKANLAGAFLGETNLTGALYSDDTLWPNDFDPRSYGAVNWDDLNEQERKNWTKKYRQNE